MWWWYIPPGLAIAFLGTSLALINFGIDEYINPRLRVVTGSTEGQVSRRRQAHAPAGLHPGGPPRPTDRGGTAVRRAAAQVEARTEARRGVTRSRCRRGQSIEHGGRGSREEGEPHDQPGEVRPAAAGSIDDDFGEILLDIRGISVDYGPRATRSMPSTTSICSIRRGEVVGLAGESGSGKSTLAYAVTRLLRDPGVITAGRGALLRLADTPSGTSSTEPPAGSTRPTRAGASVDRRWCHRSADRRSRVICTWCAGRRSPWCSRARCRH